MSAEKSDHEDVAVFVSPRHFGGRTPGPKATAKKIFEEDKAKANTIEMSRRNAIEEQFPFEGVKYTYDSERGESDTGNHVHKTVGRNNTLSKALVVLNYALVALGLYLFGVAIWVLQKQRDGGIASYSSRHGVFIKTPVWFGVCFLICALACVLSGYFVGVRHVAPSVVEGLELGGRRKALIFYQVSVAVIVIILSLVFLAAIHTLQKANHGGISPAVWQDMAKSQPAKICRYEVENKCAGGTENFCSNRTGGSTDEGCPGHYCINTCRVTTSEPQLNIPSCGACLTSFSTSSELTRCKAAESKSGSVGHCLFRLKKDVQIFLNIIVSSAGVGIGVLVLTTLLGTLSPCIHACTS